MKSFHLSGLKFDIAAEMFCDVEFSNFLLGQKFVMLKFEFFSKNVKIGPTKANLRRAPISSHAKRHQHTSLSHYFVVKYCNWLIHIQCEVV